MIKRLIKISISIVYFFITYFFNKNRKGFCIVLYYHAIPHTGLNTFIKQMDYLVKVSKPVNLDYKGPFNKGVRYSIVTFDDAFQSVIKNGVPELLKRKIPFTIFIPAALLGQKPQWLINTGDKNENERIAAAGELLDLPPELATFGSHTNNHARLTQLKNEEAYKELKESKDQLESILGGEIKFLAFPYGDYNQNILDISGKAGYEQVFTLNHTSPYTPIHHFERGRVSVDTSDFMIEFKLKVLGCYSWMPYASLLKRKVKRLPGLKVM